MRNRLLSIFIICLTAVSAYGQYDPSYSHYFDMETSFNPASAGKGSELNVVAAYAIDMAGFQNNPRTMYVSADMPFYALKSYHGAGIRVVTDKIGLFTHTNVALQYNYKRSLCKGQLAAGLQLGFISEKFDFSKADANDSSDPLLSSSSSDNGSGLDIALGLYYDHKDWYAGLSVQHLNKPEVELGERARFTVDPTYYLTGGGNIRFENPFFTVRPSLLARTDGTAWRADVTARLVYSRDNKMMYGGVGYSPANSVTVLLGGNFHGVVIGYSYEVYTSAINPGNGSHELFLGYKHNINLVKKGRNRHQSVRIL